MQTTKTQNKTQGNILTETMRTIVAILRLTGLTTAIFLTNRRRFSVASLYNSHARYPLEPSSFFFFNTRLNVMILILYAWVFCLCVCLAGYSVGARNKPGSLGEHPVLLTIETSLQPLTNLYLQVVLNFVEVT